MHSAARRPALRAPRPGPRARARAHAPPPPSSTSSAVADAVTALRSAVAAVPDAGLFGAKTPARAAIADAVAAAEATTPPDAAPTARLADLDGAWRVLYSSVTVTGPRRTQLGLRGAVSVSSMTQTLDAAAATAVNEVAFVMHFLGGRPGALRLEAGFEVVSPSRVAINLTRAALSPPALDALLAPRMDTLLSVFNPAGWLDTTFVGGGVRVGRDDKGNVFVLERVG
jgi:hypothetical protein